MFYELNTLALIHCATVKQSQAGRKYSVEGPRASVSGGETSKRFVRKRATVNNWTSQGVKGQSQSVKSRTAILGPDASTCNFLQYGHSLTRTANFIVLSPGFPCCFFFLFFFICYIYTNLIGNVGQVSFALKPFPCAEIWGENTKNAVSAKAKWH